MSIPKEAGKPGDGEKFQKLEDVYIYIAKGTMGPGVNSFSGINFF